MSGHAAALHRLRVARAALAASACLMLVGLSLEQPEETGAPSAPPLTRQFFFVPNKGQLAGEVRYYAQMPSSSAYFTRDRLVLDLRRGRRGAALELRFLGANPQPHMSAARR